MRLSSCGLKRTPRSIAETSECHTYTDSFVSEGESAQEVATLNQSHADALAALKGQLKTLQEQALAQAAAGDQAAKQLGAELEAAQKQLKAAAGREEALQKQVAAHEA